MRVQGKGAGGTRGGAAGDLYVIIHVKAHPLFERHDLDLLITVPVPVTVATLGGEVTVPTLEGSSRIKIPAGTQSGRMLRLKNKGVKDPRGYGHGDLHIRVQVETPSKFGGKVKKLMDQLAGLLSEELQPEERKFQRDMEEFARRREELNRLSESKG